ncbi:MAG: dephospho-CoA kinase [Gammaproteobacteria bacterium]
MSPKLTIALTGGIGSGKSTVADLFSRKGISIIDSDLIARKVIEPGMPAWQQLVTEFGKELLLPDQQIDRKKLAEQVFSDPAKKKKLEDLLHPEIYAEISHRIEQLNCPYCIIVIPLLVETGATDRFDRVLVVDVSETSQKTRTLQRDNRTEAMVEKIIASQASREQRLAQADDVISNDVTIDELEMNVEKLHRKYLELAGAPIN